MESNFPIQQIMQRYSVNADKELLYSYEELQRLNIDQNFIFVLLRTFEDENAFSEKDYDKFSFESIIDYIQRTHRYYLSKKLWEIEQSIQILSNNYEGNHPLLQILHNFFTSYSDHLTAHIRLEERFLLPYIGFLSKFETNPSDMERYYEESKKYSIKKFIESHHDTEKDLSEVRNVILTYQAPATNQTPYRILVSQLEILEKDLAIHALIEDKVLIPRALQLEMKLSNMFGKK